MSNHLHLLPSLAAPALLSVPAGEEVACKPDVVYGHKDGMALTFSILTPPAPNGAGVLYIPTGGWYSAWREPAQMLPVCQPLLDRGFTLFLVYHGSAPRYTVPETVADVRRCVRFIRHHAGALGVDPERLGATGASAGGHLTLMLATGGEGDPGAEDPVLRQPSRIAAAVALCPPTDIRTWPTDPPEAIGSVPALLPPLAFDPALAAGCSPALLVTPHTAPTLLIHGEKDPLVPVEHSHRMIAALEREQVQSRLLVIEGAAHAFTPEQHQIARPAMLEWFQKHLVA